MTRESFFDLVEIRTKLASLFPFIIAVLFANTYFHSFHWGKTLFFFFGMLAFDMATTAINNYMDFRKAHSEEYKYQENVIGRDKLSEKTVVLIIFGLIGFAAIVGITLAINGLAVTCHGLCLLFYWCFLYIRSDSVISDAAR